MNHIRNFLVFGLPCCLVLMQPSHAIPISWADWTSADTTSATGTIDEIIVGFAGNINPAAQTSGGTAYWDSNPATYTSPEVDNSPPESDIVRLTGGSTTGLQTITFSQAVVDPIMAILSLGRAGVSVTYDFDADFDILSSGPGFFGNGPLNDLPGDILEGLEGHGIIQFSGTFTSIAWTVPTAEFWHGFTIGIEGATPVPPTPSIPITEPNLLWLLGLGSISLIYFRRNLHAS